MIILAQDFMDILRIKKEDDIVIEEEAEEVDGRRIDPSEREGKTGTQLVDEKRRKKEREAKEGEALAEADKKRKLESATTISMWKEILEKYSKTNDVSDPTMRGTIREFSKSYLIPRSTSKSKIDKFYQSILTQEADPELLKLFFDDAKDLGIEISGDTSGISIDLSKVEKEYNGRASLEVLRSFFEDAAGIKRSVLTGKKVSDSAFRKIKEMLRDTQSIDVDELGTNPSTLLSQFRQLVLTLDRLKEEQEKTLSKSIPSQSRMPDWIQRRISEEVDKKTKNIKNKKEREKKALELRQKLGRDYTDGKFPKRTPESRERTASLFESISDAPQRQMRAALLNRISQKEYGKPFSYDEDDEDSLTEAQMKRVKELADEKPEEYPTLQERLERRREADKNFKPRQRPSDIEGNPKGDWKEISSTIDAKDKTWEYEDIEGVSYLGETSVFDNFRSVAKTVSQIIDKIEEMLQYVLDLRNRETDSDKAKVLDNTRNKMIQLVKVTVGNFEFIVGKDKFRAIKIN